MDYQKLYSKLFNGITATIEELNGITAIIEGLKKLQMQVEEDYVQMCDEDKNKIVKLNVVNGDCATFKKERYVLSVDDTEYDKLLDQLYTVEWREPVLGLLDNASIRYSNVTAVQYVGIDFPNVILFVANNSIDGKHIISISPINEKDKLSKDEHIAILENFENTHKNIRFIKQ